MTDVMISKIADAIAFAEGYFVSGSRPRRNNNPGDLDEIEVSLQRKAD